MLVLTFFGSVFAGATDHSAAFERFLDVTTAAHGTQPMCLNPLLEDMHEHRSEMSPAERAEVDAFLGPAAAPTSLPLRTRGARFVDAAPPPSAAAPRTTCVAIAENYGANQLVGERFTIAWDDGATKSEAQDLMEAFDESYKREVEELGWKEPIGMDAYNLWVYIAEDDSYSGAYTWYANCPSRGDMPYVFMFSGAFYDGTRYQDVTAHELNHAIQFAYGLDDTYDLWWWEATATWMKEYVYPDHNGWSDYTYGFAAWPEIGMHSSSSEDESKSVFWHMYGMSVWAFYLDEHVGGHDLVRGTWEYLLTHFVDVATMPEVLPDMGIDFDETYEGFLATAAVMDFEEHDWFYPVKLSDDIRELPHTATPDRSLPEGLGQNFFKIDRAANPDGKDLQVTLTSDEDVDWYVVLTTTQSASMVNDYVAATKDSKTGAWVAQLPWGGESDAYLTVSPKTVSVTRGYEYTYTVSLLDDWPPVDADDTGTGATNEGPSEKHDDGGTCASAGGTSSLLLAALSLLSTRRRRVTSPA